MRTKILCLRMQYIAPRKRKSRLVCFYGETTESCLLDARGFLLEHGGRHISGYFVQAESYDVDDLKGGTVRMVSVPMMQEPVHLSDQELEEAQV